MLVGIDFDFWIAALSRAPELRAEFDDSQAGSFAHAFLNRCQQARVDEYSGGVRVSDLVQQLASPVAAVEGRHRVSAAENPETRRDEMEGIGAVDTDRRPGRQTQRQDGVGKLAGLPVQFDAAERAPFSVNQKRSVAAPLGRGFQERAHGNARGRKLFGWLGRLIVNFQ